MTHPGQPASLKSLTEKQKMKMLGEYLDILGESEVFSGVVLVEKKIETVDE